MSQKHKFSKPLKKQTLAEQVSETVKESILNGDWQAGQSLPTEPELAEQFGVSRAVIRDATRMLAARGLVEAQHGKGVFVTDSPLGAFSDALLLGLRRQSATVWDVEQFEMMLLPEIYVLVGQEATDEELANPQVAEQPVAAPEPAREQFVPEIEIPEEEELEAVAAPSDGATPQPKPSAPREPVACDGSLEANQIRDVINGAPSEQVRTCYEQRLKDNNLLQGQMKVLLTIAQTGGVRNVSVSGSLRDAQVYSCVKRVARSWKFPRPTGGCVRTAVPFTLTPKL